VKLVHLTVLAQPVLMDTLEPFVRIVRQDTGERIARSVILGLGISRKESFAYHVLRRLILIVRPVIMELLVEYARLGTS
jgi:hypothetical protein